jgi:beta-glucosidase
MTVARLAAVATGLAAVLIAVWYGGRVARPTADLSHYARTPRPRDLPDWQQRHAGFVAAARDRHDVICLGDSITREWADHRALWAARVTRRPTAFFAIDGDTTCNLLWRIDHGELDGPPPRLVVVLVGTNNRLEHPDAADIADGIRAVVERVRAKVPTAKVLLLGVLPHGRAADGESRRLIADVNDRIAGLADGANVVYRDFGGRLLDPDGTLSEAVSHDGTHLTRAGYERWANALGPVVRELLGE